MLKITVLGQEHFDEENQVFITVDDLVLELEHSLVSLSKWESIHEKPFLSKDDKTNEETLSYVKCMILTLEFPEDVLQRLSTQNFTEINQYIEAKMSATWFSDKKSPGRHSPEVITSELVYFWMISYNIPFECQFWHLNRLFTLIKISGIKNAKPKKMPRSEVAQRNRDLNEQRRQALGTRG